MRGKGIKKYFVVLIICCFIGAGVIPSATGKIEQTKKINIRKNKGGNII